MKNAERGWVVPDQPQHTRRSRPLPPGRSAAAGLRPSRAPFLKHALSILLPPLLALAALSVRLPAVTAQTPPLWQIGTPDRSDAEFALAPGGFNHFNQDGFFVVGQSDPKRDWPYVQPGLDDHWAGARTHPFIILFGLKANPGPGQCRLDVDLFDTQHADPPKLQITVNGHPFNHATPPGAGDATIRGESTAGREHRFGIQFPSSLLRTGDNEIRITIVNGSWLLYDAITFVAPTGTELAAVRSRTILEAVTGIRALRERDGRLAQPVTVTLRHAGPPTDAVVRLAGTAPVHLRLRPGSQTTELLVPEVRAETRRPVAVEVDGTTVATGEVVLKPVRHLTIYLLPHSHTDIGYTQIQTAIQQKQVQNLLDGIAAARRTADYPAGARFVWNVEVLWAADLYLHRLDATQRAEFLDAVKRGQVALNGMYLNELTGLCRPEELLRLFRFATRLEQQTGVPIDAAMISDVPGYTWGTVTAMAQAGIRYFSAAPNYFDRIGSIMRDWENKPFWWIGPDGHSRVLTWIPFWGYALSHRYGRLSPRLIDDFFDHLDQHHYPYDLAYFRWSGHGDNAVPDPAICDYVRDWNTKYAWPHFVIASTSRAFHDFDRRYGRQLPVVRGDWTPYWEDGAGSSARETALNRANADRLTQAESVFAMFDPQAYPATAFDAAWKDVLLYSEHTWGAWCSISQPDSPLTLDQWAIKRGYVTSADRQSRKLLDQALSHEAGQADPAQPQAVDVWNTLSWPRTDLVTLDPDLSTAGDRVVDDHGQPVPSQRLTTGQLAFLARDVPPFAARRYTVTAGTPGIETRATADTSFTQARPTAYGGAVDSGTVRAAVDAKTGGIVELTARGLRGNFVDTSGGESLNDYLYLIGDQLEDLQHNGPVTIRVGEPGPLVASLTIQSAAPGCKQLVREVRVVAGRDYVELIDTVDKQRLQATNYYAHNGKESVNFAFPFAVPGGQIRLDTPLAGMRPDLDQIPSACKNWFVVGRWADVANHHRGVTWVTLDAPLVEIGGLTARLLNSQTNPDVWRKHVGPTQKIYSWAMNNHWGTNYRAYQEGRTVFRFMLRPHRHSDPAEATRFATAFSFPLLPVRARGPQPARIPFLRVDPLDVPVITLKPSDDGRALIVRLFGASGHDRTARLDWGERKPAAVFLSDTSEQAGRQIGNQIAVPAYGVVTLRAEY